MQTGLILALIASVVFAGSGVAVRRGVAKAGESFTAMATSIFIGLPIFAVVISFSGDWGRFSGLSIRSVLLLAAVGVIHFIIGRLVAYNAYRLIGVNKAMPFAMTSPFYAVFYGVFFLHEPFTVYLVLGTLGTFAGVAMITTEKKSIATEAKAGSISNEVKGILLALGAGLCWGTTPMLIKLALNEVGSPVASTFLSYGAAAIIMLFFLLHRQSRRQLSHLPVAKAIWPLALSAIFAATGQLLNYAAYIYSPTGTVTALICTQVLFISVFSYIFNRNIEIFSTRVIIGAVLTVVGSFLLFL